LSLRGSVQHFSSVKVKRVDAKKIHRFSILSKAKQT
jgi:hypothetical protein